MLSEVGGTVWPVQVQDISPTEIRLVVDRPMKPGAVVILELYSPARDTWLKRPLQVAECRDLPPDHFLVACAFLPELSDREFQGIS